MFALRAHKKGTKGASVCVVGEEEEEEEVLIKGAGTFYEER